MLCYAINATNLWVFWRKVLVSFCDKTFCFGDWDGVWGMVVVVVVESLLGSFVDWCDWGLMEWRHAHQHWQQPNKLTFFLVHSFPSELFFVLANNPLVGPPAQYTQIEPHLSGIFLVHPNHPIDYVRSRKRPHGHRHGWTNIGPVMWGYLWWNTVQTETDTRANISEVTKWVESDRLLNQWPINGLLQICFFCLS